MNLGFKDATALVVGGGYGIGGAVVRMLAEEGANVTAVAAMKAGWRPWLPQCGTGPLTRFGTCSPQSAWRGLRLRSSRGLTEH